MQLKKNSWSNSDFGNSGNISVCHFANLLFCLFCLFVVQMASDGWNVSGAQFCYKLKYY